jgi:RimJ/RimL family protein N-acetyltransferase
MIKGPKVTLRMVEPEDLPELFKLIYGEDGTLPEWKNWDAPYFPFSRPNYKSYIKGTAKKIKEGRDNQRMAILVDDTIIGTVNYYWENQDTKWLEAGIGIYRPDYWNGGYGTEALAMWVEHLFQTLDIPRVGITTWSGNERMMKAAEKVGMILEGRLRKCRYYNGEYYDSIRMGILREEWEEKKPKFLRV